MRREKHFKRHCPDCAGSGLVSQLGAYMGKVICKLCIGNGYVWMTVRELLYRRQNVMVVE
jgi:DnaJ-class molecular chaperone